MQTKWNDIVVERQILTSDCIHYFQWHLIQCLLPLLSVSNLKHRMIAYSFHDSISNVLANISNRMISRLRQSINLFWFEIIHNFTINHLNFECIQLTINIYLYLYPTNTMSALTQPSDTLVCIRTMLQNTLKVDIEPLISVYNILFSKWDMVSATVLLSISISLVFVLSCLMASPFSIYARYFIGPGLD